MSQANPKLIIEDALSLQAAEDRRQGERYLSIMRVGKLVKQDAQELCVIRNISSGGLMAHVTAHHAIGDRIEIELKSDVRLSGEVVWVKDGNIGVRFDGEVEVSDILTHRPGADGRKSRAPRLEVHGKAVLKCDDLQCNAEIRDISQGGMKVDVAQALIAGRDIVIKVKGLETMKGVVRWCREGQAGLAFLRPIPFDALTRWLEDRSAAL
nr:PilZ domain-containing protein [Sphingobium boeckii]